MNKAGAAFGESTGYGVEGAATGLATGRIIHVIAGLRKSQDEDKTLTKGTISSIKEPEKLHVFLPRVCGLFIVGLCTGVYGKELYHALKRTGAQAKHALTLMRWPCWSVSFCVALCIAGFFRGGVDPHTLLASDCVPVWTRFRLESQRPTPRHQDGEPYTGSCKFLGVVTLC